ncbi:MAG: Gfo/Idh/MocA family oxidoreductase [Opitutae bacterium]|nr:Gfo/Idh/MocA family oxidoreductase [Opitutae bacterium]MCD8298397.1 Gfo/Idh/MocA family oxidoreductase [Opitutae bacterium]
MQIGKNSRRDFIKKAALAGAGMALAPALLRASILENHAPSEFGKVRSKNSITETRPRVAGAKPVHDLTTSPMEKVRVAIIGLGQRGLGYYPDNKDIAPEKLDYWGVLGDILNTPFTRVTAVCDLDPLRAAKAVKTCLWKRPDDPEPKSYSGSESAWEKLSEQDDIDVVYICTPWEWHVPMALKSMKCGKHAFIEVAAAVTVDECWDLVDTSELTQKHCVILENCCYGDTELLVLNMARQGVFGELTHAECAYIHDLRSMLFWEGTEGDWRREYHKVLDGNLYPTHGLGPVCQYLGVNRGDLMTHLVSMSSLEKNLSAYRDREDPNDGKHANEKYICGDVNTTLIKTALGRTIMVQHDVVSPRPYSRINALTGTGATFFDYPPRLAVDQPKKYGLKAKGSHSWLKKDDFEKMNKKFMHPLWKQIGDYAKDSGHGGMDYIMSYRLLDCIRSGITPDMTVYDTAAWSSIIELSARSVEMGSMPVAIPDFTRGLWRKTSPLGIVEAPNAGKDFRS